MTSNRDDVYRKVLRDEESLVVFLRAMRKFDQCFCDAMTRGIDFTLKMEVHGNGGNLIHARVNDDGFDRPRGSRKTQSRK